MRLCWLVTLALVTISDTNIFGAVAGDEAEANLTWDTYHFSWFESGVWKTGAGIPPLKSEKGELVKGACLCQKLFLRLGEQANTISREKTQFKLRFKVLLNQATSLNLGLP